MFMDKGMTCLQSYGTADVGTIAYESDAIQRVDEGVILEIVRPGTGDAGAPRAMSARWSSLPSTRPIR